MKPSVEKYLKCIVNKNKPVASKQDKEPNTLHFKGYLFAFAIIFLITAIYVSFSYNSKVDHIDPSLSISIDQFNDLAVLLAQAKELTINSAAFSSLNHLETSFDMTSPILAKWQELENVLTSARSFIDSAKASAASLHVLVYSTSDDRTKLINGLEILEKQQKALSDMEVSFSHRLAKMINLEDEMKATEAKRADSKKELDRLRKVALTTAHELKNAQNNRDAKNDRLESLAVQIKNTEIVAADMQRELERIENDERVINSNLAKVKVTLENNKNAITSTRENLDTIEHKFHGLQDTAVELKKLQRVDGGIADLMAEKQTELSSLMAKEKESQVFISENSLDLDIQLATYRQSLRKLRIFEAENQLVVLRQLEQMEKNDVLPQLHSYIQDLESKRSVMVDELDSLIRQQAIHVDTVNFMTQESKDLEASKFATIDSINSIDSLSKTQQNDYNVALNELTTANKLVDDASVANSFAQSYFENFESSMHDEVACGVEYQLKHLHDDLTTDYSAINQLYLEWQDNKIQMVRLNTSLFDTLDNIAREESLFRSDQLKLATLLEEVSQIIK